jgi:non-specific serine/threonine protein kinase
MVAYLRALTLAFQRKDDEVSKVADLMAKQAPEASLSRLCLFLAHALKGDTQGALDSITPYARIAARWDAHLSWTMAGCYALVDQKEQALDWLENAAINRGFINYPLLSKGDPLLENLRGDDRFSDLMVRVKKKWQAFKV